MPKKTRAERDKARLLEYLWTQFRIKFVEHQYDLWWHKEEIDGLKEAPFTVGLWLNMDKFEVHGSWNTPWAHILHEAGHLVATNKPLAAADEEEFLGWEIAVIQYLKLSMLEWYENNREYGVNYSYLPDGYADELQDLRYGSRPFWQYVGARLHEAKELRLIVQGEPAAVRLNSLGILA